MNIIKIGMFLPWTVNQGKIKRVFPLRKKYFLPFHFGKKWEGTKKSTSKFGFAIFNLTTIYKFFMPSIHIWTLEKIRIGYSPRIYWFATNL